MLKTFVVKEVHLSPGLLFPSWEEQLSENDRVPLWSSHLSSLIDVYSGFLSRIHLSGHYVLILANLCLTFKPPLLFSFHGFVTPFRIRISDPFIAKSKHAVKSWILQEFYNWSFKRFEQYLRIIFSCHLSSIWLICLILLFPIGIYIKRRTLSEGKWDYGLSPFLFKLQKRLDQL